jgi:perosamine synthetase
MIKKFDLSYTDSEINDFLCKARQILKLGFLAEGPEVSRFERDFARLVGFDEAVAVGSGTDALAVAYRACMELSKKRAVTPTFVIPANTFVATDVAARQVGAHVKFSDTSPESGMLTLQNIQKCLDTDTIAVVYVHIGGFIDEEIFKIRDYLKSRNIFLIEDAAHCVGSWIGDISAGSIGDFGCFSFYPTKSFTTGEGGAVVSSLAVTPLLRAIKNFGRTTSREDLHTLLGYNFKVTEFQAALGQIELKRFQKRLIRRRELFKLYREELLGHIDALILHHDRYHESSCYKIILRSTEPWIAALKEKFAQKSLPLGGQVYSMPVPHQEYLGAVRVSEFPGASEFCSGHICLPLYPELTNEEALTICSIVKEI